MAATEPAGDREYGRNPYQGYDSASADHPFLFEGKVDSRIPVKTHVLGLFADTDPLAIAIEKILAEGLITVAGPQGSVQRASPRERPYRPATYWFGLIRRFGAPWTLTTLRMAARLAPPWRFDQLRNRARPSILQLRPDGKLLDRLSGSEFNGSGNASAGELAGELAGERLQHVPALDTFWFASVAFSPDTRLCSSAKCGVPLIRG